MNNIHSINLWRFGEESACRFLRKQGYKIVERNYRTSHGEIDIIAKEQKTLIFLEVRTRSSNSFAEPWETIGYRKRKHLRAAAKMYIQEKRIFDSEFRFDVISITLSDGVKPEIKWIQNAF